MEKTTGLKDASCLGRNCGCNICKPDRGEGKIAEMCPKFTDQMTQKDWPAHKYLNSPLLGLKPNPFKTTEKRPRGRGEGQVAPGAVSATEHTRTAGRGSPYFFYFCQHAPRKNKASTPGNLRAVAANAATAAPRLLGPRGIRRNRKVGARGEEEGGPWEAVRRVIRAHGVFKTPKAPPDRS